MHSHVRSEIPRLRKVLVADLTLVRPLARMRSLVHFKNAGSRVRFQANIAGVRLFIIMLSKMIHKMPPRGKLAIADFTLERLLASVSSLMGFEVPLLAERLTACGTYEWLLPCVLTTMVFKSRPTREILATVLADADF